MENYAASFYSFILQNMENDEVDSLKVQLLCWLSELEYFIKTSKNGTKEGTGIIGSALKYVKTDTGPFQVETDSALDLLINHGMIKMNREINDDISFNTIFDYERYGLALVNTPKLWELLKKINDDRHDFTFSIVGKLEAAGVVRITDKETWKLLETLMETPSQEVDRALLKKLHKAGIIDMHMDPKQIPEIRKCYDKIDVIGSKIYDCSFEGVDGNRKAWKPIAESWIEFAEDMPTHILESWVKKCAITKFDSTDTCEKIIVTKDIIRQTRKLHDEAASEDETTIFNLIDQKNKQIA